MKDYVVASLLTCGGALVGITVMKLIDKAWEEKNASKAKPETPPETPPEATRKAQPEAKPTSEEVELELRAQMFAMRQELDELRRQQKPE